MKPLYAIVKVDENGEFEGFYTDKNQVRSFTNESSAKSSASKINNILNSPKPKYRVAKFTSLELID